MIQRWPADEEGDVEGDEDGVAEHKLAHAIKSITRPVIDREQPPCCIVDGDVKVECDDDANKDGH